MARPFHGAKTARHNSYAAVFVCVERRSCAPVYVNLRCRSLGPIGAGGKAGSKRGKAGSKRGSFHTISCALECGQESECSCKGPPKHQRTAVSYVRTGLRQAAQYTAVAFLRYT